nr:MAG TPA: hypothetical protein [Caudoviricetes sp.]
MQIIGTKIRRQNTIRLVNVSAALRISFCILYYQVVCIIC